MSDYPYIPRGLLLQWHLTERCNLRCRHCYHSGYDGSELDYDGLLAILQQYQNLLEAWRQEKNVWGHINVTGGEPFLRADFFTLLETFFAKRRLFSYAILTNGTLIDRPLAERLKKLGPKFVQVSIEGGEKTHDSIRGVGNFEKSRQGLQELKRAGIPTYISFTAHAENYQEFAEVARFGRSIGVTRVWSDRLIPDGSGKRMAPLSPAETCGFIEQMQAARKKSTRFFSRTEIAMQRALQFHSAGGRPYRCSAGDSLVTVQTNGDVYPCRRMPLKVGNLKEADLSELYYDSELFAKLRDREKISAGCEKCFYAKLCNGGLRCLSQAVYGDPFRRDPGCWTA